MVDAASRLHDGIWPTSSPTPAPKIVGCKCPETQCEKLAIVARTDHGFICTKPAFIPSLQGVTDCDRRIYDWREGGVAQSAIKESKAPTVNVGTTADIIAWTRHTLDYISANAGNPGVRIAAAMFLHDQDVNVSIDVLEALGNMMLDRLHFDKPWAL